MRRSAAATGMTRATIVEAIADGAATLADVQQMTGAGRRSPLCVGVPVARGFRVGPQDCRRSETTAEAPKELQTAGGACDEGSATQQEVHVKRALRIDPTFSPCIPRVGDEMFPNGIFEFNITRMVEYLQTKTSGMKPIDIAVDELPWQASTVNEAAVCAADLDRPIVLAEIAPDQYNLIDGHHRAEKARRAGVKTLKAYRVRAEQHVAFLTTERAYHSYIEYYNDKLKAYRRSEADKPPHRTSGVRRKT